ncbi:MAG: NfeD family protein [Leptospirales bacterium]|nr:NfeD family protein [Leptospirales bacterium]
MTPIMWFALGLFLIAVEIIAPGFVIFWFGLSGIITALFSFTGIIQNELYLWILFFWSSTVFLILWFGLLKKYFNPQKDDERDPTLINLSGKCTSHIEKGRPGEVELYESYHGLTKWKAESSETILEGEEIHVVEASGIKLIVKKI